jgi:hypothetical protein
MDKKQHTSSQSLRDSTRLTSTIFSPLDGWLGLDLDPSWRRGMPPSRQHLRVTARHEIIGLGEISMGQRRMVWEMERLRIIGITEKEVYLVRRMTVRVMRVLIRCLFQRNVISQLQGFRWDNLVHFVHNSLAVCTTRFTIALSRRQAGCAKARGPRAPCGQKSGTHFPCLNSR